MARLTNGWQLLLLLLQCAARTCSTYSLSSSSPSDALWPYLITRRTASPRYRPNLKHNTGHNRTNRSNHSLLPCCACCVARCCTRPFA